MGYSVVEWSNTVDITPIGVGIDGEYYDVRTYTLPYRTPDIHPDWELYESQTKQFQNFITRANRYPSLQLGGSGKRERKVVVVEVRLTLFNLLTNFNIIGIS